MAAKEQGAIATEQSDTLSTAGTEKLQPLAAIVAGGTVKGDALLYRLPVVAVFPIQKINLIDN